VNVVVWQAGWPAKKERVVLRILHRAVNAGGYHPALLIGGRLISVIDAYQACPSFDGSQTPAAARFVDWDGQNKGQPTHTTDPLESQIVAEMQTGDDQAGVKFRWSIRALKEARLKTYPRFGDPG
jgi:hypothetical protein